MLFVASLTWIQVCSELANVYIFILVMLFFMECSFIIFLILFLNKHEQLLVLYTYDIKHAAFILKHVIFL